MAWFDAEKWMPRDGEKILFHCQEWRRTSWEIGRFCKDDRKIYNHYSGRAYDNYDWNNVDYWMKVPKIPELKKENAE